MGTKRAPIRLKVTVVKARLLDVLDAVTLEGQVLRKRKTEK